MNKEKSLLESLADFQDEMLNVEIIKNTEAYGYKYAELEDILNIITPILRKHKIGYYHLMGYDQSTGKNIVFTTIYNLNSTEDKLTSKTLVDDKAVLAKMNRFMVEGAASTYFRRYQLTLMLGLTSEKDTDAGGMRTKDIGYKKDTSGASQKNTATIDYVNIFKNLTKNKSETVARKSFDKYKPQLSNDDIKKIEIVFKEAYENN